MQSHIYGAKPCLHNSCAVGCLDPNRNICWEVIDKLLVTTRTRMEEGITLHELWQVHQDAV